MNALFMALFTIPVMPPAEAVKMLSSGAMLAVAVFKATKTGKKRR